MTSKSYVQTLACRSQPDGVLRARIEQQRFTAVGPNSPKRNDRLELRTNPVHMTALRGGSDNAKYQNLYSVAAINSLVYNLGKTPPTAANDMAMGPALELYNSAYARLRGKVYSGSGALGVSLAGYKQSREMVVDRFKQLGTNCDEALARIATARTPAKAAAGVHLEVIFGWVPLLQDIHAATTTVIGKDPVVEQFWFSAQSTSSSSDRLIDSRPTGAWKLRFSGSSRCRVGFQAEVLNQNLWLAERAGLINLGSVAWDVVPWSFVVNMFMNTGQLVNSITDYMGLRLTNPYTQYEVKGVWESDSLFAGAKTSITHHGRLRRRVAGTLPRPSFEFRVPEMSWSFAAMAGSLFAQKFSTLSRVMRFASDKFRH